MAEQGEKDPEYPEYREYQRLEDCEEDSPPGEDEEELLLHVTEGPTDSWHHIKDLDSFFTKIYHFHQRNGFACVVLSDVLELVQFLFVVTFSTFLLCCVDYDVLFATRALNQSHVPEHTKVTLPDAVLPAPQCARRLRGSGWLLFLLVLAGMVWLCRLVTALRRLVGYWEIRSFYIRALGIPADELCNHSWQSVQARLLALQRRQPLCVPRRELTELDIHHRILRFRNYTVAMVNKSLLPVRFHLPLLGPVVFLTRGLQFNLELLLFRGPAALFQNTWSLRPQVKRAGARRALARGLARAAVLLGVANLALCPCVLGWRLLLAFFSYAEGLKRAPGSLGARRWSLYARHYLRHFNELGHELQARLSRGHAPATKYMDSFSSPLLAVLARHVGFFAGSVLAVLIVLTVYDEDVLTVQHILTAITLLGLVVTVARSFIPDEHSVWCPEQLLQRVLAHVHYLPEHWQGRAGRAETRAEMAQLFQYKAVFILEELLSPLVTPLILIFAFPPRALDIVDFFRNFTVEVAGVGDICSFAQLDVRHHGNPQWLSGGHTEAPPERQAEHGKTELSLMRFALSNPRWRPPPPARRFLGHLHAQVTRDAATAPPARPLLAEGPLPASLLSEDSALAPEGLVASVLMASGLVARDPRFGQPCSTASATASLLASLRTPLGTPPGTPLPGQGRGAPDSPGEHLSPEERPALSESRLRSLSRSALLAEVASAEMSLHAIYLHQLHQQQQQPQGPGPQPAGGWVTTGTPKPLFVTTGSAARASQLREMPLGGWAEEEEEEEEEETMTMT
ncbi:autophagy-related protein 9B [Manacus candei]|uniref:autophagy-related protein 9B n=1 Tax=Manacus candei TaxID=415023 RepID=UPI00222607A4|nr:autophagy-related protein 9B [Manacus candei]XP_051662085.1 autophagy-related protein 9B [Manacus candei]XP_051662086.1 autophagy-related protein 9B [Manacus candei]